MIVSIATSTHAFPVLITDHLVQAADYRPGAGRSTGSLALLSGCVPAAGRSPLSGRAAAGRVGLSGRGAV